MRVWMYYADVGGGHRMAARALAEKFSATYGTAITPTFINATAGGSKAAPFLVDHGYEFLINKAEWLWKVLYQISKLRWIAALENWLLHIGMWRALRAEWHRGAPDAIVASYFLVGPLLRLRKHFKSTVPIVVVVTDWFTVHPMWFHYSDLTYIVFSESVRQLALRSGVEDKHITVLPPIVSEKFFATPTNQSLIDFKIKYGLSPTKKTVLIVGGGTGLPHGTRILKTLLHSNIDAQYVVVCGNNVSWYREMCTLASRTPQRVVVFGFVDFMQLLLSLCDVAIIKAGPAMVMETVLLKKPMIITHYIWEQEKGNMRFVADNKLGFYEPSINKLPTLLKKMLHDASTAEELKRNGEHITIRNGTADIADYIYQIFVAHSE